MDKPATKRHCNRFFCNGFVHTFWLLATGYWLFLLRRSEQQVDFVGLLLGGRDERDEVGDLLGVDPRWRAWLRAPANARQTPTATQTAPASNPPERAPTTTRTRPEKPPPTTPSTARNTPVNSSHPPL